LPSSRGIELLMLYAAVMIMYCPAVMLFLLQLDIYKSLPSGVQQSASQKLDVALATVAIGYQRHQPQVVQRAAALFQQLGAVANKVRCSWHLV
jgi:hypothetical protein